MFIGSSRDPIFSIKAAEIEAVYRAKGFLTTRTTYVNTYVNRNFTSENNLYVSGMEC